MSVIKKITKLKNILGSLPEMLNVQRQINLYQNVQTEILIENYLKKNLLENPRYQLQGMLNMFEKRCFSQSGEDGIIAEIFRRIGKTNKYFVEFGVQDGLECNTTYLLFQEWEGLWFEGNFSESEKIKANLDCFLKKNKLRFLNRFITPTNFENSLREFKVPIEFDLLSIDIDFNDYWVWESLTSYKPRVIVIEYNAFFPPPIRFVVKYDSNAMHDRSIYYGASLKSLDILGQQKGYQLVGCSFSGVNAFFVRDDLVEDKFIQNGSAENLYEPQRGFLIAHQNLGLRREIGEYDVL